MSADGQKIRAVIFDMDGCLIDSEPLSLEAVAAEMRNSGLHDVTAEEVGAKYLGVSINQIIVDAGERLGHPARPVLPSGWRGGFLRPMRQNFAGLMVHWRF